ncbi:hypothetical protein B0H10DRAFT_2235560 [Mycena sp. CBHHK59/15]|nr:hypothetical protein B0H10DRAFT_2235560 [Mycena sp. CBHHK59/15]
MASTPLKEYFWRGEKQNSSMYHTYCKACVAHHLDSAGTTTADLAQSSEEFKEACKAVGSTRGEKLAWIAHLIGGKAACPHASEEAKRAATAQRQGVAKDSESKKRPQTTSSISDAPVPPPKKQHIQSALSSLTFRRNEMPYGTAEAEALRKQALRAIDPEMQILIGMIRTTAPAVLPTGKVAGGRLLDQAAADVELRLTKKLKGRNVGLCEDGWKSGKKESVTAVCANVDFKRIAKENTVSKAFMQYLARTGDFEDFNAKDWESLYENTDPIEVWEALVDSAHLAELARFAIIILNIVANQAGCERTFLRTKVEQADHHNRLGLEKTDKRTKVRAEIRSEHEKQNLLKPRHARKNHKSTATLLSVPQDEDQSERGRALVSSAAGWRTEMGKWIGDARAAEREEAVDGGDESDNDLTSCLPNRLPVWKQMTLAVLFRGAEKPRARKPAAQAMEQEELLMQALAEAEEDGVPDDGAIEIDSDDEFRP